MCELMAVSSREPIQLLSVLPWALGVERMGIAGYGWGISWLDPNGRVDGYRYPGSLASDDLVNSRLNSIFSTRYLIHLRRPTRLSTIQLADTQPFVWHDNTFAFCHNGNFKRSEDIRARYEEHLLGDADSEIGLYYFKDLLARDIDPDVGLAMTNQLLEGASNLGYLDRQANLVFYCGHPGNAIWQFAYEGAGVMATEIHSPDDSLFELLFPKAEDRVRLQLGQAGGWRPDGSRMCNWPLPREEE
jgi:hypothetical protein